MNAALRRRLAWGFVLALVVLHDDFWSWADRSLVFGFMPVGLYYQALMSLLAGVAWALVVKYAWPTHLEQWAEPPLPDAPPEPDRDLA